MPELRRSTRSSNHPSKSAADASEPAKKKIKSQSSAQPPSQPEIEVGDAIPNITLLDEDENEVSLTDAAKKTKYVIIFAYPKASTPGCTRQVCGFQKNYKYLKGNNVTVFGLSADSPKAQKNFVNKQSLEFPLLSDPSKKLIGVLGAKKSPSGIKRSHWIFVDGILKVKKIQIGPEASFDTAKNDIADFIANDINKSDDSKKEDESVKEDAKEEPVNNESTNEPINEELKEESSKEEPAKEEPAKEEPAKEEPAKEEPANEEPANE